MSIQSLTPPQDITWKRMAFSRDMIDTNFGDMAFPPKWRTSLTVYYYIVPEEETVDAYPESRIVYLKLSASITGWNPNEELVEIMKQEESGDYSDDLQKSIWEAIEASGWASKYWGCHGAIMQVGIFPSKTDEVTPDDYPYIMDFEPKKRELFEAVSEGTEILSGSSENISLSKGTTSTKSVTAEAGWSPPVVGGFSAKASASLSKQTVENKTTDTSREDRETKSHSTTFSQMYQLFNGYHLGTNRAVFVVSPRPHTTTGTFNLINGERQLEGLQDVFLVINMPRSLKGFCVQATIDTGHKNPEEYIAQNSMAKTFTVAKGEFGDPPCLGGNTFNPPTGPVGPGGGGGGTGGGNEDDDETSGFSFIVTRRMVQSCGEFDENGLFKLKNVTPTPRPPHHFVGETFLPVKNYGLRLRSVSRQGLDGFEGGFDDCYNYTATLYNNNLSRMSKSMLEIFSSGRFKPKSFKETNTFKSLYAIAAKKTKYTVEELHKLKYITEKEYSVFIKNKVISIADIFKSATENMTEVDINAIRKKIVNGIKK